MIPQILISKTDKPGTAWVTEDPQDPGNVGKEVSVHCISLNLPCFTTITIRDTSNRYHFIPEYPSRYLPDVLAHKRWQSCHVYSENIMLHDAHVQVFAEDLYSMYSDLFKDVHGCRPRHGRDMSPTELCLELDTLGVLLEQAIEEDARLEAEAIASVEATIKAYMAIGAQDRATAIAWLDEAYDTRGDMDYLCYHLGLPYGYFPKAAQAA